MIEVGSVWYVWGEHREVLQRRTDSEGVFVLAVPVSRKSKKPHWTDWVLESHLERHGKPSEAYAA